MAAANQRNFARLCRTLLDQFETTTDPIIAERVARTCALSPAVQFGTGGVDAAAALKLAELAVRSEPSNAEYRCTRGALRLRLRDVEGAINDLGPPPATVDDAFTATRALFVALAYGRLQRTDEAQALTDRVAKWLERTAVRPTRPGDRSANQDWYDIVPVQALLNESRQNTSR